MFRVEEIIKAVKGRLASGRIGASVRGVSIDSRAIKPGDLFIAIKGDNFDGHAFIAQAVKKGAAAIIGKPGGARGAWRKSGHPAYIEVRDTIRALGDLARYHRSRFAIPVVAITGSSGKTTAKEMIAWVMAENFPVLKNEGTKNNHIGVPLTLLKITPRHKLAVLEIGSNHFGEVRNLASICRPTVGVITNIGPAHLEYFHTLAGAYIEKATLLDCLLRPQAAILNADDFFLKQKLSRKSAQPFMLGFGLRQKTDFLASRIRCSKGRLEFTLNKKYSYALADPGIHNIYNALTAIAVGRLFGLSHSQIARRLAGFQIPPGRGQIILRNDLKFIDDTYNANPLSFARALSTLQRHKAQGRKILVMGDMLELGDTQEFFHRKIGSYLPRVCDTLVAVGGLSKLAAQAASEAGFNKQKIFFCKDAQEARQALFNLVKPQKNDIILVKGSRSMRMEEVFKDC